MSMEVVKVNCIFPTVYVEMFGDGGYEVDKEKVKAVLAKHNVRTYDTNMNGLFALINSLDIEERQKEYIIDVLVADEPDDVVAEFLKELKKTWKIVTFEDSLGFSLRLRINVNELERIKEVFEKEFKD